MKKITIEFQPAPSLEVNGHTFELQMSDADIFDRAMLVQGKMRKMNAETPVKQIVKTIRECAAWIDEILGEGAMLKIANGKPVRMTDALKVMNAVAEAAAESYAEKLESYE